MRIITLVILNAILVAMFPNALGRLDVESERQQAWAQYYEDTKDLSNGFDDRHRLR
jgi:hypothetical protein